MRSARKRMLASNRAEVGSTFVVRMFATFAEWSGGASLRSAMGMNQDIGLFTVYHSRRGAQRTVLGTQGNKSAQSQEGTREVIFSTGRVTANACDAASPENAARSGRSSISGRP